MIERIEACVTDVLRRQAGHTLSLQRLHEALVHELGTAAGSYHQLHQRLKQAGRAFVVFERPSPLLEDSAWPPEVRAQYAMALRNAGLDLSPLVSLTGVTEQPAPGLLNGLEETLGALRAQSASDPQLAADLLATLSDLADLQDALLTVPPTTTAPRDLLAED